MQILVQWSFNGSQRRTVSKREAILVVEAFRKMRGDARGLVVYQGKVGFVVGVCFAVRRQ